jgi:hypothetical protein
MAPPTPSMPETTPAVRPISIKITISLIFISFACR